MPEFFGLGIESGAAADDGPEFPSELAAQVAEGPPAQQKVLAFGRSVAGSKILAGTTRTAKASVEIAFDFLLQRLDHARNGDQHRNTFAADRRHDFGGVEGVFETDGCAQQRWKKCSAESAADSPHCHHV